MDEAGLLFIPPIMHFFFSVIVGAAKPSPQTNSYKAMVIAIVIGWITFILSLIASAISEDIAMALGLVSLLTAVVEAVIFAHQ